MAGHVATPRHWLVAIIVAMSLIVSSAYALTQSDRVVALSETSDGSPASWGIDRIDQRELPLDSSFDAIGDGAGVDVYVLDTGIDRDHSEFAGRLDAGFDAVDGDELFSDGDGHGTQVAGIIGGTTYGIARSVTLIPVRVWSGYGDILSSEVVAGIDWVLGQHELHGRPSVINLSISRASWSSGWSSQVGTAVLRAIRAGIHVVSAAGDSNEDGCNFLPGYWAAVNAGASDANDNLATDSNFGGCVDVVAPGEGVVSAVTGGGSGTFSGTNMAAAHVTGVAALMLSIDPTLTPNSLKSELLHQSTHDVLTVPDDTPNRLLHVAEVTAPTPMASDMPFMFTRFDQIPLLGALPIAGEWVAARSGWHGFPAPLTERDWYRCRNAGVAVTSGEVPADCQLAATGTTYLVQSRDEGFYIRVKETAWNTVSETEIFSASSRIAGIAPSFKGVPKLQGRARVGQHLRGILPVRQGTKPITLRYSWWVCNKALPASSRIDWRYCAPLWGERSLTLRIKSGDFGKHFRFGLTGVSDYGSFDFYSATSGVVR